MIQFIKEFFGFKKIEVAKEQVDTTMNLAQQMYALTMKVLASTNIPDALNYFHAKIKEEANSGSFELEHTFGYYWKSHKQFAMTENLKKLIIAELLKEGFTVKSNGHYSCYYTISWKDAR